jgi:hypothetical protein
MSINLAADLPCKKSAGAPANEIEFPPRMIEAGVKYLEDSLKWNLDTFEDMAREIYISMTLARFNACKNDLDHKEMPCTAPQS